MQKTSLEKVVVIGFMLAFREWSYPTNHSSAFAMRRPCIGAFAMRERNVVAVLRQIYNPTV